MLQTKTTMITKARVRKIIIEDSVHTQLDRVAAKSRDLLWDRFDALTTDPFSGIRLFGQFKGMYVIDVFPYKVIYKVVENKNAVVVITLLKQTVVAVV